MEKCIGYINCTNTDLTEDDVSLCAYFSFPIPVLYNKVVDAIIFWIHMSCSLRSFLKGFVMPAVELLMMSRCTELECVGIVAKGFS